MVTGGAIMFGIKGQGAGLTSPSQVPHSPEKAQSFTKSILPHDISQPHPRVILPGKTGVPQLNVEL